MTLLYDLIFLVFALLSVPYLTIKRKWHAGFIQRMGFFSSDVRARFDARPVIWVHAVSVGEVLAVVDLIGQLKARFPAYRVVLTTVTPTGYALASGRTAPEDVVLFAPLDFSLTVRRFIALIRPQLYITAETEIWPGIFHALQRRGIPIVQVNGRISEKSFRRYGRLAVLARRVLSCVTLFCVQTPADARRLTDLGAAPERVHVVGNMKFDFIPAPAVVGERVGGLGEKDLLWIAGSTHPGEEEIVGDIYTALSPAFPGLRLMVAPRHVERTPQVEAVLHARGLTPVRLSAGLSAGRLDPKTVVVVDTIGQLRGLYPQADVVFIGKSLTGRGGQNIIEPAALGKAVVVGPQMQNFAGVMAAFREHHAIVQVPDAAALREEMRRLLLDPAARQALGDRAAAVVAQGRGATEKTIACLSPLLASS